MVSWVVWILFSGLKDFEDGVFFGLGRSTGSKGRFYKMRPSPILIDSRYVR